MNATKLEATMKELYMQEIQIETPSKGALLQRGRVQRRPELTAGIHDVPYVGEPAEERTLFVDYLRTVLRHKTAILVLGLFGMLIAFFMHVSTDPLYRSRTSLDIQSLNGDFMNLRSVDPMGDSNANDTNLQTQIKLLQSDSLQDRVEQRIESEPHPAFLQRKDLVSRIRRVLHLDHSATIPFASLLETTAKQTKVKPMGMTRLVEVSCASWSASFAARYCNTLASEFVSQDLDNRGTEAKQTSEWLMRQAADVKQKSEDTEKRLFAATGGNGLILSQQSDTVGEDRLRQLQSELVKAQADRMQKEAETAVARRATINSTPNIVSDPSYAASRMKLAELEATVSSLVPPLTEQNPRVIHLREQIKQIQQTMVTQGSDSAQRLRNEYAAAKHREDLLALSYHAQEASVSADMEKGSRAGLLRRELESEQQLYQTLLQKAKEAGFASAMHASTIRVVDAARVPAIAAYPRRILTIVLGTLVGLVVGLAFAFFKERNTTVLRTPGDATKFLNIDELGVIPSPAAAQPWSSRLFPARARTLIGSAGLPIAPPPSLATQRAELLSSGWNDPFSLVAEAYRNVTLSLLLSRESSSHKTYIVSSPNTGEGKTTVTTNLGIALSRAKLRVALIDGDLRRPSLHHAFSLPNNKGLRNILDGEITVSEKNLSSVCLPTRFNGLQVIPSGTGNQDSGDLLHSPQLRDFLKLVEDEFDIILIDTPPALHMTDARILAGHADGTILVLRSGQTTRESALSAHDVLVRDGAHVIGTVLNDFDANRQGHRGYYSSYYAYQGGADRDGWLVRS